MSRLSVDPVSFNCPRYVRSGGRWRQMPGKRWWTHSLWVDWTTATPCVRASMKACWTSCSIFRMRLLDLSRTHGNTIISLLFFEICTGSQFVKESSSSWRAWSTNVSTVCVHPTLQRTAYCCLPLVVGSTCDRLADWNYTCSKNTNCDFWPAGFCGARPGGLEFSAPALREPTLSFNCLLPQTPKVREAGMEIFRAIGTPPRHEILAICAWHDGPRWPSWPCSATLYVSGSRRSNDQRRAMWRSINEARQQNHSTSASFSPES